MLFFYFFPNIEIKGCCFHFKHAYQGWLSRNGWKIPTGLVENMGTMLNEDSVSSFESATGPIFNITYSFDSASYYYRKKTKNYKKLHLYTKSINSYT